MSITANSQFLTKDRVKLPFEFDADKMLAEIKKIGMNDFINSMSFS